MTELGVAVIGCGFQGAIHAGNVARSSRATLVSCVDLDGERAASVAAAHGAERHGADISEIWTDPEIDAVVIATTTHTHHELALAAAEHGKHMVIEKPMAITVDECLEIERACEAAGVVVALGYKFRFTDAVKVAREAIPRPKILVAQTLYDPSPPGANAWVNDRALGGGRMVSSLVHSVDLLRFLSGDEVAKVFAEGATVGDDSLGEPDTSTATLLFRDGAIGSIVHGTAGASGLLSTWSFQAAAAGANATIHDHGRRLNLHREGEPDTTVVDPVEDPFEAGTAQLFEAFAAAVSSQDVEIPGPRDGTLSLLVSRCVEESIATGQPVVVPAL
jgi:myo-inositol 2-dehydrogenase/D-chiro-inositol 1-dehydrogenase